MTVNVITKWDKSGFQNLNILKSAKEEWLALAVAEGRTTEDSIRVNELTSSREWRDQAAAEEWKTFITNLGALYGYTVNVTIT